MAEMRQDGGPHLLIGVLRLGLLLLLIPDLELPEPTQIQFRHHGTSPRHRMRSVVGGGIAAQRASSGLARVFVGAVAAACGEYIHGLDDTRGEEGGGRGIERPEGSLRER